MKYVEEVEKAYTMITVMEEASRCLLCHDAPCSKACPAGTDPARFIRSIRFRNFKGAAEIIRENNALGASCARVCPTEKYCQKACSRCGIDKPINIGGLQRFATDYEQQCGMEILHAGKSNGKRVGIIGSGPAGLQAAASLLQLGYDVDIIEKNEKPGGYLRYGIPEYHLPNAVVDNEVDRIVKLGAKIKCGVKVDQNIIIEKFSQFYDAVLLAVGFSKSKMLDAFKDNPNVETATSFLARVKEAKGEVEIPQDVVVIGGGDSAMDVSTTLKLLGAKSVTNVIRKEFSQFRATQSKLAYAQSIGVTVIGGYVPQKMEGKVVTFKHCRMNSTLEIEPEKVILAVGQEVDGEIKGLEFAGGVVNFEGPQLKGTNVFVAGDIAHGDKTVVWAVKTGKEAAEAIHNFLGGNK